MTLISFAPPNLQPEQRTSISVLPPTGVAEQVTGALIYDVYRTSDVFISAASDFVGLTYQSLGGPILDLEITPSITYVNFERSVLEYSKIVNNWQAKNAIGSLLGGPTGTFNGGGEFNNIVSGSELSGALNPALTYPMFTFTYARTVQESLSIQAGIGGNIPHYSASIPLHAGVQDYDLNEIISSSAADSNSQFFGRQQGSRIVVTKVFYRSMGATWRFFGYYGGLQVVGNLNTYGQYSDDSTFEVVPIWQNKLQAQQFETNLWTRTSHYSYRIFNNTIRLFPVPTNDLVNNIWFEFYFEDDRNASIVGPNNRILSGNVEINSKGRGVNNLNTVPFANIPFENINSMGQQWIREYALALTKETLSLVRGKMDRIPIPGNEITLNSNDLYQQAQTEKEKLKEDLEQMLNDTSYQSILAREKEATNDAKEIANNSPIFFYMR